MTQTYSWDAAGRLSGLLTKKPDGTELDATAYDYDAAGQRIQKTGRQPSTPETSFTATYDTANRLVAITFTNTNETWDLDYDPAGRLVRKTRRGDGASTQYIWDARGRLKEISGSNGSARFDYDALGRRIGKTVNGQTTGYLHDGEQVVAELQGNRLGALYLTGLGIDEALARIAPEGTISQITDALGSVMAELDAAGNATAGYAYSPYGETVSTGDSGNPVQYTARENDGTGLYYYRARYYDPVLKRFISEDPIGIDGGFNIYTYVNGNPISYTDPTGLMPPGADPECFKKGNCKCATAECAAGLPPIPPPDPNAKCKFVVTLVCMGMGPATGVAFPLSMPLSQGCSYALKKVCDAEPGECTTTFLGAP